MDPYRPRTLDALSERQRKAVEAFERAFGVDLSSLGRRKAWSVVQDEALAMLYEEHRAGGMTGVSAMLEAGDELGMGEYAVKSRYYRNVQADDQAA